MFSCDECPAYPNDAELMVRNMEWTSRWYRNEIYWSQLSEHGRRSSCETCAYFVSKENRDYTENSLGVCFVDPKPQAVDMIRPACSRYEEDHPTKGDYYPALFKTDGDIVPKGDEEGAYTTLTVPSVFTHELMEYLSILERETPLVCDYDRQKAASVLEIRDDQAVGETLASNPTDPAESNE